MKTREQLKRRSHIICMVFFAAAVLIVAIIAKGVLT